MGTFAGGGAAAVIRGVRRAPTSPPGPATVMWLHIQMEYCRANLRDVLDREAAAGTEVDEERAWAWGRQVLEGLAHIHAQVKPDTPNPKLNTPNPKLQTLDS
jgi:hypothetical protein